MSNQQLYKIEYEYSTGWDLIEEAAHSLTKEKCDELLSYYLSQGYNPQYLRAVRQVHNLS
jgi:hypothetical protein